MNNWHSLIISLLVFLSFTSEVLPQWMQTGPYGGTVYSFAVKPNEDGGNNIFAGTSEGLYLSTNEGISWSLVNKWSGAGMHYPKAIAFCGNDLYAGIMNNIFKSNDNGATWGTGSLVYSDVNGFTTIGNNIYSSTILNGIWMSTDNGSNWTAIGPTRLVYCVTNIGTTLFVGLDNGGVARSSNNGETWIIANLLSTSQVNSLAVNGTDLYAGTYGGGGGIFRSTDGGVTWAKVITGLSNTEIKCLICNGNNIFAGTNGGVFRSINNGQTWFKAGTGLNSNIANVMLFSGDNLFAGTNDGFFLTNDNAVTWSEINTGFASFNISALAAIGYHVFVGTPGGGVFLSTNNGLNWTAVNSGLTVSAFDVKTLQVVNDSILYAAASGGLFRTTNYGTNWVQITGGGLPVASFCGIVSNGNKMFTATYFGIYRSTDNGSTWTDISSHLPIAGTTVFALNELHLFAGVGFTVFHSTNDGNSWTEINNGWPQFYSAHALYFIGATLFAATGLGTYFLQGDTLWIATSLKSNVNCLTGNGSQLFAGTGGSGVFQSTDFGINWNNVGSGLTGDVRALVTSGTSLFAGTNGTGVWVNSELTPVELTSLSAFALQNNITIEWSTATENNCSKFEIERTNQDADWKKISEINASGNSTTPKNYSYVDKKLHSGKYSYRLKIIDYDGSFEFSKIIEAEAISPDQFYLYQNYPNPFNPITTIEYSIPLAGHVSLKVFDVLGKEVASLVNEDKPSGCYSVEFDAGKLSSAFYIYELRSGNFVQTKKMILMK